MTEQMAAIPSIISPTAIEASRIPIILTKIPGLWSPRRCLMGCAARFPVPIKSIESTNTDTTKADRFSGFECFMAVQDNDTDSPRSGVNRDAKWHDTFGKE